MIKVTIEGDPKKRQFVLLEFKIGWKPVKALIPLQVVMRGVNAYEEVSKDKDIKLSSVKC